MNPLLTWAKTMLEDDAGKVSIKRVIALLLSLCVCALILKITFGENLALFIWDSTNLFLGAVFTFIMGLVTANVFEKKHILENKDESNNDTKTT